MNKRTIGQHEKRQLAAKQAARAIAVGILQDQVEVMLRAGAFHAKATAQAEKVLRHCASVMGTLPRIRSSRGVKNIESVCDIHHAAFAAHFPGIRDDSAMSALTAIFSAHHAITELRRVHRLKAQPWAWLDQTSTTLVDMLIRSFPEEEGRMFEASLPFVNEIVRIAA